MQGFRQKTALLGIITSEIMYRRPSRKIELWKRTGVYTAMAFLVVFLVSLMVLIILGYRVNINNGQVERNGLLQFLSEPSGARILIDGEDSGRRTSDKFSVTEGVHNFSFELDGYRTWEKQVDVRADTLTWLNYARLIPIEPKVDKVYDYSSLSKTLGSPNSKKLLVQKDITKPVIDIVDLQDKDFKVTRLNLPSTLYSKSGEPDISHNFNVVQWDPGSRYVLMRHTYSGLSEWMRIDTELLQNSVNVTALFSESINSVKFSGTSGNVLYGLINGKLRKLDTSAETISRALVTNVIDFNIYDINTITYTGYSTDDKLNRVAGIYRDGDSDPTVLRSIKNAPDLILNIATSRYFDKDYIAITQNNKVDLYAGSYPSSGSTDTSSLVPVIEMSLNNNIKKITFSSTGEYVVAQSDNQFASYDIEYEKSYTVPTGGTMSWLDKYHLWKVENDKLIVTEFDGANVVDLGTGLAGHSVVLSDNEEFIYSVVLVDESIYRLQQISITTN